MQADARSESLRQSLQLKGLRVVDRRAGASIFVVQSPVSPGDRVLWRAILVGGYLVTQEVILNGKGVAMSWCKLIHSKRHLWLSKAFQRKHPASAEVIKITLAETLGKKWQLIQGGDAVFRATSGRSRSKGRRFETIGIVDKSEKDFRLCVS